MKTILAFIALSVSIPVFSQTNLDYLVGKWVYQDIYENELIDSTSIKMLESFFGDLMLQFNEDESYQAVVMGRPDQGIWTSKGENTLYLRSNEGNITPVEIISLQETEFICKIERGEFIMKKSTNPLPAKTVTADLPYKTVAATTSEISHRWNLKKKDYNKELSESAEEVAKNIQGSIYMNFRKNGRYESQLLGLDEKGSWKFSRGNKSITTSINGQMKIWNIISVSETELVLIQGNKPEKWYFNIAD